MNRRIVRGLGLAIAACLIQEADARAHPVTNLEMLPDGTYMFSSREPDRTRHPDIQLAGSDVFVLRKRDREVFGEHFIANSSDSSCFRGVITDSTRIVGEGIAETFPERGKVELFPVTAELKGFHPLDLDSIPYARDSVQRCRKRFERDSK